MKTTKITKEKLIDVVLGVAPFESACEVLNTLENDKLDIDGYERVGSKKQLKWRKFNPNNKRTFPKNEKGNFLVASENCQTNAICFKKDIWERSGILWWLELPEVPPLPKF